MANPNLSELDWNQALKRTINADEDTVRVELSGGTDTEIQLDAADGDSVATRGLLLEDSVAFPFSTTGVIIPEMDVEGYKQFQFMANITSPLTGSASLVLEISPVASGDIWLATTTVMTLTAGTDLLSAVDINLARRIRVSATGNTVSAGAAVVYLLSRG